MRTYAYLTLLACALTLAAAGTASAKSVTVTITNLSPANGIFATPAWLGFHDGGFDLYDRGEAPSVALEQLAEDGSTAGLTADFERLRPQGVQGTLPSVIAPGQSVSARFELDPVDNRYFSYATMVIPSNDAFVANGNPLAHPLFDDQGRFKSISFVVFGRDILDAGTERNTELDAAFINQSAPNTGVTEGGVVTTHPGFIGAFANAGTGGEILGGTNALGGFIDPTAADFTLAGYEYVDITITPIPGAAVLLLPAVAALGVMARRRAAIA